MPFAILSREQTQNIFLACQGRPRQCEAMESIPPPKRHAPYPDRDIDCQQAIEAAFQELMERASAAGWRPVEIAEAVGQVAIADRYCA